MRIAEKGPPPFKKAILNRPDGIRVCVIGFECTGSLLAANINKKSGRGCCRLCQQLVVSSLSLSLSVYFSTDFGKFLIWIYCLM